MIESESTNLGSVVSSTADTVTRIHLKSCIYDPPPCNVRHVGTSRQEMQLISLMDSYTENSLAVSIELSHPPKQSINRWYGVFDRPAMCDIECSSVS